jgi:hypothetical protein
MPFDLMFEVDIEGRITNHARTDDLLGPSRNVLGKNCRNIAREAANICLAAIQEKPIFFFTIN